MNKVLAIILVILSGLLIVACVVGVDLNRDLTKLHQVSYEQTQYVEQLKVDLKGLLDEIKVLEDSKEFQVKYHKWEIEVLNELMEELRKYGGLEEFESHNHLVFWLNANDVSEREYIEDIYDCENFAFDLVYDAIADNKVLGLLLEEGIVIEGKKFDHLKCFAPIKNSAYKIEPQTDAVERWGVLD